MDGKNTVKNSLDIGKNRIETQFIVFYDMKVKIIQAKELNHENNKISCFVWRSPKESELNKFYFSDRFTEKLVARHFHPDEDSYEVKRIKQDNETYLSNFGMTFPSTPFGIDNLQSYSWLECTLFYNGIMSVVLRLQSKNDGTPIEDSNYLESVSGPEYVRNITPNDPEKGNLVSLAWLIIGQLEKHILELINGLDIMAIRLDSGSSKNLEVVGSDDDKKYSFHNLHAGKTKEHDGILIHRLEKSRPYIGTYLKIDEDEQLVEENYLMRFAIASARTTPEFLYKFDNPKKYLEDETPRRNIYYPGNSIVFIARRGWCCIQREERKKQKEFHMGVIEVVLFIIQAIFSSVRSTRRFKGELIEISNKMMREILTKQKNQNIKLSSMENKEMLMNYAEFISRARLSAPLFDISSLLDSHINTHTGISAALRLKKLTFHDDLKEKVDDFINCNSAFVEQSKQNIAEKTLSTLSSNWKFALFGIIVSILGIFVYILFELYNN